MSNVFQKALNYAGSIRRKNIDGSEHFRRIGSGLDVLYHSMEETRKITNQSVDPSGPMKAVCLTTRSISDKQLTARFGEKSPFIDFLTSGESFITSKDSLERVIECHIFIPEVSGVLPQPDLLKIEELSSRAQSLSNPEKTEFNKQITRLLRFPKAYILAKNMIAIPDTGSTLEVVFFDKENFSFGAKIEKVGST